MSELSRRSLTALLLLPAVAWWILYAPSPWFDWILGALALATTIELLVMLKLPAKFWLGIGSALAWALLVGGTHPLLALLMLCLIWFVVFAVTTSREGLAEHLGQLALGQWMLAWLWFFVWALMQVHARPEGPFFIAGACLGVWTADIAAYFAGRSMGRHKLIPQISPNKTVEGLLAAFIFGIPVATAFWLWQTPMQVWLAPVLAVLLVAAGAAGDLAESALKRALGLKDSGRLLPGHGGLLDRIDALLLALPVCGGIWLLI